MRNQLGSTVSMYVSESTSGVIIKVQVQTRASRDEVVGTHNCNSSGGGGEQAFA